MRQLTVKQKKRIDKWIDQEKNIVDGVIAHPPFKNRGYNLDVEDMPSEIFDELVRMNDTEILYQEVNRYVMDKCSEIIHKL